MIIDMALDHTPSLSSPSVYLHWIATIVVTVAMAAGRAWSSTLQSCLLETIDVGIVVQRVERITPTEGLEQAAQWVLRRLGHGVILEAVRFIVQMVVEQTIRMMIVVMVRVNMIERGCILNATAGER